MSQIGILFIFGYGSSMTLGTWAGSTSDRWGRKLGCVAYCVLMAASSFCNHYKDMPLLIIGRIAGGVATSLLYSAFEAWAVCAFHERGLPAHRLGSFFSTCTFANACVAILAGLLANWSADLWGYVAPFILAAVLLLLCAGIIIVSWDENYGSEDDSSGSDLWGALKTVVKDPSLLAVCAVTACFEGAMFVFIFEYTPSLTARGGAHVPLGIVFAIFMVRQE